MQSQPLDAELTTSVVNGIRNAYNNSVEIDQVVQEYRVPAKIVKIVWEAYEHDFWKKGPSHKTVRTEKKIDITDQHWSWIKKWRKQKLSWDKIVDKTSLDISKTTLITRFKERFGADHKLAQALGGNVGTKIEFSENTKEYVIICRDYNITWRKIGTGLREIYGMDVSHDTARDRYNCEWRYSNE